MVVFVTNEQLVAADTDSQRTLSPCGRCHRADDRRPRRAQGPTPPTRWERHPTARRASSIRAMRWSPRDTDTHDDAYMYSGGTTTLLSGPGPGGCFWSQSYPVASRDDGAKVFIQIDRPARPPPTRTATPTSTSTAPARSRLVQAGPGATSPRRCFQRRRTGCSSRPTPALLPADTDAIVDLYRREGGGADARLHRPDRRQRALCFMLWHGVSPRGGSRSTSGRPSSSWPRTRTRRSTSTSGTRRRGGSRVDRARRGQRRTGGPDVVRFSGLLAPVLHRPLSSSCRRTPMRSADIYDHSGGVETLVSTGSRRRQRCFRSRSSSRTGSRTTAARSSS